METNIVILSYDNGHPTGVSQYINMLKKGLRANSNYRIHIVILDTNIFFPDIKWKYNELVARIPFEILSLPLKELYWQEKYFRVVTDILTPYFDKLSKILWHVQELFLCRLADRLKTVVGGKIILHLHILPWKFSLEKNERLFNRLYNDFLCENYESMRVNRIEKNAYELSDKIICVSYSAKQYIMSVFKVESTKILVVFNGLININTISLRSNESKPIILFVGRISKEKGVLELFEALKKIYKLGKKITLKLIGDCTNEMKMQISRDYKEIDYEISSRMPFEKLCEFYSNCMIGVVPSLHEQCSYVAIEMSMFGMPMIVSDVDALSEMFEDNVNALKIPLMFDVDFGLELDKEKLVGAINELIDDEELRKKLSRNAIKNYHANFTLEKMIGNTINVYEQLIKQYNA